MGKSGKSRKRVRRLNRKAIRVGKPKNTVMKKMLLFLVVLLFSFQIAAFSQKTRVGIMGGTVISHMYTKINGIKEDNHGLFNITAGMLLDVPLAGKIVFRPNLSYVQKGKWRHEGIGDNKAKISDELRYAEMYLNFIYNISSVNRGLFVGIGPSVSFDVPSKREISKAGTTTNKDVKFGKTATDDYKGMDYGANIVTGFNLGSGMFLAVNYNQGFRNLVTGTTVGKIKNSYFGFQLGMLLKNK